MPAQRIQPVEHHPLIAAYIRSGMDVLMLDQFRESLRGALQTEARMIQPEHDKNLAANLEAEIVAPLQVFRGLGKCQAKFSNCIDIHSVRVLNRMAGTVNQILQ